MPVYSPAFEKKRPTEELRGQSNRKRRTTKGSLLVAHTATDDKNPRGRAQYIFCLSRDTGGARVKNGDLVGREAASYSEAQAVKRFIAAAEGIYERGPASPGHATARRSGLRNARHRRTLCCQDMTGHPATDSRTPASVNGRTRHSPTITCVYSEQREHARSSLRGGGSL